MSELHVFFSVTHNFFAVAASAADANALLSKQELPKTRRTGHGGDVALVALEWEEQPDDGPMVLWFTSGLRRTFATLEEAGGEHATRFEKTHGEWAKRLGLGVAKRRCPYLQADDMWLPWMHDALARQRAAMEMEKPPEENVQRVNEPTAEKPEEPEALLRELVAYADSPRTATPEADLMTWMVEFVKRVRKVVT